MLFTSFDFLILLIVTLTIYYTPYLRQYQVKVLIGASLIFYAHNQPVLLLVLISSVAINTLTSYYTNFLEKKYKLITASLGVVLNLLMLSFFKYSPLIASTFFNINNGIGSFLINIPLPIGISFYTFQGISLLVDVYRKRGFENNKEVPVETEKIISTNFFKHATNIFFFICFFPQSIAGPIVKAHDFVPQIGTKYFQKIDWQYCFKNLIVGYFLKAVVADNLSQFTFWIEFPYYDSLSSLTLIILLLGYSAQIFADFAGYSLIALGTAALFGYRLKDNFNFPYISSSIAEFWKRWHISLSSFLMEYLYIPLGGNRKGKVRTLINLMITMILGGLWHGAAWSYAIWGVFHGILLVIERIFGGKGHKSESGLSTAFRRVIVFVLVSVGWVLFKLPEFSHVIGFFRAIFENTSLPNNILFIEYIFIYSLPIFLYHITYLIRHQKFFRYNYFFEAAYGFMFFAIILNSGISGNFIYFQF